MRATAISFAKMALSLLGKEKIKRLILEREEKRARDFINKGYLKEIGWWESWLSKQPVRGKKEPIPWVTYPFIHFIEDRILPYHKIFEFGSGNSTIYYAKRAANVTAVEHDKDWFNRIKGEIPSNTNLLFQKLEYGGDYCSTAMRSEEKFDIIIVDGRDRVNCIKNSIEALSEGGVIILDDSEREKYRSGILYLKNMGFKPIDFWGISPGYSYLKCTSVYYRNNNVLDI